MRPCIQLVVTNPDTTMLVGNLPQANGNTSDGEEQEEMYAYLLFSLLSLFSNSQPNVAC
jgi:hypothetical protein